MPTAQQERLRRSVRFFYDLQKLRVQSSNRNTTDTVELTEDDAKFMESTGEGLNALEKQALKQTSQILKGIPIYTKWLKNQKGCGPTMSGVLLSEIDIHKADTASALWRFCGLAVDSSTGKAERRTKGQKSHFSPWLKSKILHVLGDCLIKANSPWRAHYDNYKHRKENTILETCMGCNGTGKATVEDDEAAPDPETKKKQTKKIKCPNCSGTGGPASWGCNKAHRHNAAMRNMVKMFLLELWTEWRTLESLPVTESYSVAVLGRKHGDHGGTKVRAIPRDQPTTEQRAIQSE